MKPLTILLLIALVSLASYRLYDWWVCTKMHRKKKRGKMK